VLRKIKHNQFAVWLLAIWLLGAICDRIWFILDKSIPAWDQADYLTGTLNYWQALQQPQWFNHEWWTSFWLLSTKIPPLTYIVAANLQNIFGKGLDQATLVNLLGSAILLISVYGLGRQLFNAELGLFAAAFCLLLPSLYRARLDFLLDYPLSAIVSLCFLCLTVWKGVRIQNGLRPATLTEVSKWFWAAAFGICFGLAMLVKQTALLFLLTPLLWVGVGLIRRRQWGSLLQLISGLLLSIAVFGPWYRTNWLTVLTSGKRATIDSAIAEGDPALNTIAAWTYYGKILPYQVSWLLLLVPVVGLLLYWKRLKFRRQKTENGIQNSEYKRQNIESRIDSSPFIWLAVYLLGAYLLCSLNVNKDERYVLPYLPVVALFLAYGLTCWRGRWGYYIRASSVGLATILMLLNIFPVGGLVSQKITQVFSPKAEHYAYFGSLPHAQVINAIIQTDPNLRATLGVLPSTAEINQHNLNYYGALRDFQVYGRQVGTRKQQVLKDTRSLDWFLTKTGNQGSVNETQAAIVQIVERSPDFKLHKFWNLPDGSYLQLYHRRTPTIEVRNQGNSLTPNTQQHQFAITEEPTHEIIRSPTPSNQIVLSRLTLPQKTPPGVAVPVTYEWSGAWEELQSGLVLLKWQNQALPDSKFSWLHDHGIGMGNLIARKSADKFKVIERMAMLPPANLPQGTYTLEATYLNRRTYKTYAIAIPPVSLIIDSQADVIPAPELDLLTQLRVLASTLPQGSKALEPIFAEVARINQYDPTQDYLVQTQQTLTYRLEREPQNRDWAYTLALSRVLKRQVNEAIAALERVTQLDPQNPYAYAYLAFVHLYNWHASAATAALKQARALNPNLPEIQALSGVAALMQGNLVSAWHYLSAFKTSVAQ